MTDKPGQDGRHAEGWGAEGSDGIPDVSFDAEIERLLATVARQGEVNGPEPDLPPDLMARILADAAALQPGAPSVAGAVASNTPAPRGAGWRELWRAIGGWPAAAGLATSAVTGLWLGVSPPDTLSQTWDSITGAQVVFYDPGFGLSLEDDDV